MVQLRLILTALTAGAITTISVFSLAHRPYIGRYRLPAITRGITTIRGRLGPNTDIGFGATQGTGSGDGLLGDGNRSGFLFLAISDETLMFFELKEGAGNISGALRVSNLFNLPD